MIMTDISLLMRKEKENPDQGKAWVASAWDGCAGVNKTVLGMPQNFEVGTRDALVGFFAIVIKPVLAVVFLFVCLCGFLATSPPNNLSKYLGIPVRCAP